jgi:5-formaminoimidazole-4-carboxamide-1-beta-D-ribofuranosyl 5'-monophosphate synthetase
MSVRLVQSAELIAMNVAIQAMGLTSRSSLLSRVFRHSYQVIQDGNILLWSGVILASGIAGFLTGYLGFYVFPK